MIQLNRRTLLSGAAAAALAPVAVPRAAHAAAPAVGKQTPGFFRYKLGGHEITVVNSMRRPPFRRPSFSR